MAELGEDFYRLMNVSRTASQNEIRKAYRKRALELHPDKNPGSEDLMKRLTMAKEILLDSKKRADYDEKHDDLGGSASSQEISGYLQKTGKRLSRKFQRKLEVFTEEFNKITVINNIHVINECVAGINSKFVDLINDDFEFVDMLSDDPENEILSSNTKIKNDETIRRLFYEGNYKQMVKLFVHNHCSENFLSILHQDLVSGRDIELTPNHFQAGLHLLKAGMHFIENNHRESLESLQAAFIACPSDEVIAAVNTLLDCSKYFSAAALNLVKNLLSSEVTITGRAEVNKYQDRLNRSNGLRVISRFEHGVLHAQNMSYWNKACLYIDLTMSGMGIAAVHCFYLATTYMLQEMAENDNKFIGRSYALLQIISELTIVVVSLAKRLALPITEVHMNRLCFLILKKAHELFISKYQVKRGGFFSKLISFKTNETLLVTLQNQLVFKHVSNTLLRLMKVCPFVELPMTTAADMIYLDCISDRFVESYYKHKIAVSNSAKGEEEVYLFKYHLLEGAWKNGKRDEIPIYRDASMSSLLKRKEWSPEYVEENIWWDVMHRDENGWLDTKRPWLNLLGQNFDSVDGVIIDPESGHFEIMYTPTEPGQTGLFNCQDIAEVLYNGINFSVFTLDPPDNDLQYHPFHEMRYHPKQLEDTNFLKTLLHADYLLKMMSTGTEVNANSPHEFRSAEEGFLRILPKPLREKVKSLKQRRGGSINDSIHRFWIESGGVEYDKETKDGKLVFWFGDCKMFIKTHLMKPNSEGELVDDSEDDHSDDEDEEEDHMPKKEKILKIKPETEFANDLTECYDDVGFYFPVLLRLREMTKLATVYSILHNIYVNLEKSKTELVGTLSKRYREILEQLRNQISYPLNTYSEVNRIYNKVLSDQNINANNLASGEESRAKSEIRKKLREAEENTVDQLSKALAEGINIEYSSQLRTKVENWLNDGMFVSHTSSFVKFLVEETECREWGKLNRFAKHAAEIGISFEDKFNEENDTSLHKPAEAGVECPWVPAVFSMQETSRVYGGVLLVGQPREVNGVSPVIRSHVSSAWGGGGNSGGGGSGHGNSRTSSRAQHVYKIVDNYTPDHKYLQSKTGSQKLVHKFGISHDRSYARNSAEKPDRIGASIRGQRQADDLNKTWVARQLKKYPGDEQRIRDHYRSTPRFTCEIVQRIEAGPNARIQALNVEDKLRNSDLKANADVFGIYLLPGNREASTMASKLGLNFRGKRPCNTGTWKK